MMECLFFLKDGYLYQFSSERFRPLFRPIGLSHGLGIPQGWLRLFFGWQPQHGQRSTRRRNVDLCSIGRHNSADILKIQFLEINEKGPCIYFNLPHRHCARPQGGKHRSAFGNSEGRLSRLPRRDERSGPFSPCFGLWMRCLPPGKQVFIGP